MYHFDTYDTATIRDLFIQNSNFGYILNHQNKKVTYMKKLILLFITTTLTVSLLAGCGKIHDTVPMSPGGMPPDTMIPGGMPPDDSFPGMTPPGDGDESNESDDETKNTESDVSEDQFDFTSRDENASYDITTEITLSDKAHTVSGDGATVDGTTVTITKSGVYQIKGSANNARIVVSAAKEDKIQLVFAGVTITSTDGPAIFISSCDKVFLTLAKACNNTVTDNASYTFTDPSTTPDGAIFSREDLTINAEEGGKLTINGNYKHGIVSKDDLVITSGEITVSAQNVALNGKDAVKIAGGSLRLTAGSDAIRSDNTEDTTKGFVYIHGGDITIEAANDGIQAETSLRIDGGTIFVKTGSGAPSSNRQYSGTESKKGFKAGGIIEILGGEITVNSEDDGVHSNNEFAIHAGSLTVSSGDDGIHADTLLTIANGRVTILKSYEGIEAQTIAIKGGTTYVTASDDGINASSGSSNGNDFGDMWGGGGGMQADASCSLTISGGYLVIDASGDGLDSNGYLTVSGGVVLVAGPTNSGNGALDYGSSAEITGGTLIALGASGMAEGFKSATVGSFLTIFSSQNGNQSFAVVNEDGNVIASFYAPKSYNSAVVASPEMEVGSKYTIIVGGTVEKADENGFANNGKVTGGNEIKTVTLTSLTTNSGGGGFGGGGGGRPR